MYERNAFDELLWRARGEYLEMPGLHLTVPQAARLWALDAAVCDAVLSHLAASGFLRQTAAGTFALATGEERSMAAIAGTARADGANSRSHGALALDRVPY